MIEFRNVTKEYSPEVKALDNISIKIPEGEFVFVVGPSGSGKSTFLKLLTKEEEITSGDILINNESLKKMKRRKIPYLRRTMGIVFQDFRLIPTMNVFQNVAFAMHVVGASDKNIRREVSKVLSKVGLGHKARSMPSQLSGGEQQRVGLARALINSPDLIIADEPTGNVDPNMSYEIVSMLTEINKQGTTVLMVTHDHNLVRDFQHRVIMLDSGRIVADNAAGGAE